MDATDLAPVLADLDKVVILTGAGVSAASGIPTFRGEGGYWRPDSRVYRPEELATREAFEAMPEVVWPWYLWRRSVCRAATPNAAHASIVKAQRRAGVTLVTQNVDGLHLRAGSPAESTFEIHGNIDYARCAAGCGPHRWALPREAQLAGPQAPWSDDLQDLLACPRCGVLGRPHVLWFDETYDEHNYRWDSSLEVAQSCDALVIAGTAGMTNLPRLMAQTALSRGALMVDINPSRSPFSQAAVDSGGVYLASPAEKVLPHLLALIDDVR